MSKLKSILLLCAPRRRLPVVPAVQPAHRHRRARDGGYDGASTRSPEDVDRAVREAEEAAAKAQAARPEAQRGNQAGPSQAGPR